MRESRARSEVGCADRVVLGKEIGHLFLRDQEGSQDRKRNVGNRNVDRKGSQGASRACV